MARPDRIRYSGHSLSGDGNIIKRAQSFSSSTDFSEEKILELANVGVAELVDTATVSATLECNDYGVVDNFLICLGQGLYTGTANPAVTTTDTNFENAVTDFIVQMSDDESANDHSVWLGSMFLTGFDMSYSADGFATESYNFEGDIKRWFLNTYKNAACFIAAYTSATVATITGYNLATQTAIAVTVNNIVVASAADGDTITLADSAGDTTVTLASNLYATGDRIRVIVAVTTNTFNTLPSTPSGIGAIRRGMVEIMLRSATSGNPHTEDFTLRLQNVSISASLERTEKQELGRKKVYYRSLQRPIDVAITAEFNTADLRDIANFAGQGAAEFAGTLTQIDIDDFLKDNTLEIVVFRSETSHLYTDELKRIIVSGMGVSAEEGSTTVGEDGTVTMDFTGDNFLISGSGVTALL